jgi:hypothetical protein
MRLVLTEQGRRGPFRVVTFAGIKAPLDPGTLSNRTSPTGDSLPNRKRNREDLGPVYERRLARFIEAELEQLEMLGGGDTDYAYQARDYLRRYDAALSSEPTASSPLKGRHLRAV